MRAISNQQFSKEGLEWVQKPRTLYWEYLFLSEQSPLRQYLKSFEISKRLNPFDLIEDTEFLQTNSHQLEEKILPSSNPVELKNYKSMGAYIALFSWFGVTDLHKDNLIFQTINDQVKIIPIDIESIFNDIFLPSETYLIPKSNEMNPNVGLYKIIEQLKKDGSVQKCYDVIDGYLEYLLFLDTIRKKISDLVLNLDGIYQAPIRSIVRNTEDYQELLKSNNFGNDLDKSEMIQLSKHKIPYYFHYLKDNKVYYYKSPNETSPVSQSSKLYSTIHKFSRRQGVIPSRESLASLIEAGSLQLANLLLPKNYIGNFNGSQLNIEATENEIILKHTFGHIHIACDRI